MKCLTDKEITNYILEPSKYSKYEEHFNECDECLETLLITKRLIKKRSNKINNVNEIKNEEIKINYKDVLKIASIFLISFVFLYNNNEVNIVDVNLTENNEEIVYYDNYLKDSLESYKKDYNNILEVYAMNVRNEEELAYYDSYLNEEEDYFEGINNF